MKYWIETYGCQMNKAESEALELALNHNKWKEAEDPMEADLTIINTCSVRETAETRIWGRIGYYKKVKKNNPAMTLIITGCMAERLGNKFINKNSPVDKVFGTFTKNKIIDSVLQKTIFDPIFPSGQNFASEDSMPNNQTYEFNKLHTTEGKFKAFVPIMNGCNNFCSYCIVPYVRGRELSRNPEEIFSEIEKLETMGVKEITLLGQNVNSYYYEDKETGEKLDFPFLLKKISQQVSSIEWIRFLTSHPKDLSEKLISVIAESTNICRHIHLPLQSGSDVILKKMNRKYNSDFYNTLIKKIKDNIPDMSITTDIIVGFPGETQEDYNMTYDMINSIKFNEAFTYYYNPREGTNAFNFGDDIPKEEKIKRLSEVIKLQRKISIMKKKEKIGTTFKVLAEGFSKNNTTELIGRTESDEMIVFNAGQDRIGLYNIVKILFLKGNTFIGETVK
ncbi:MAG: tRNA (N6-isopentenyl adenosine(37)-C2)-methylthiotransferase MiaB [Spirochaetes bacterium]|nr:tRNA (N6-isopentenyl adenosine(37)-C2)-methylthiotransferase MiaB [Spirochaetota bacterium]